MTENSDPFLMKTNSAWPFIRMTLIGMVLIVCLFSGSAFGQRRININKANARELQTLPYIGKQRAESIVKSRQQIGRFRRLTDLVGRKLIGQETFKAIENRISLHSAPSPGDLKPISITNIHINGLKGEIFLLENKNFARVLTAKIMEAKESIRIVTFLFKTSTNKYNYATQLAEELIQAGRRGVQVEVILEQSDYSHSLNESNGFTLRHLKKNGIKVRFDSIKRQTHTKLAIIDDKYTFIGSHNLSHSALGINNELSLMIESKKIAKKSMNYFRSIK